MNASPNSFTFSEVVRREAEGAEIAKQRIVLGSELHADEGAHITGEAVQ